MNLITATRNLLGFPKRPSVQVTQSDLGNRHVFDDPRDSLLLWLPRTLTVQQVVNILRASRMGDLWQLSSLIEVMLDSWPMLKKCQHELRSAVANTKFSVHPYAAVGQKPTQSAQEKADLVERAMRSFKPNPATDEKAFSGLVYDLTHAYLLGISIEELQWYDTEDGETLPRAATFVHATHIVFDNNGAIALTGGRGGNTLAFNPNFFISSQFQSQSGSVLAGGMIRSVGYWWSILLAVQEWMFSSAQKHGSPYTFLTYARNLMGNTAELDKLEQYLTNAGKNRFVMAPEGTVADMKPPGTMGADNPQRYLKEQADKEVQMLFLGQSSSTEATPGKLGNDDQHQEVRRERVEAVSKWIGEILTVQFAAAVLRQNYGTDSECPLVQPDFTAVETSMEAANRIALVSKTMPICKDEAYDAVNHTPPKAGDYVLFNGQLGVFSDAEKPIQPTIEQQLDEQAAIAEAQQEFQQPVAASEPRNRLKKKSSSDSLMDNAAIIAVASTLELDFNELQSKLAAIGGATDEQEVKKQKSDILDALPIILATALLSDNAKNAFASAMATSFLEGVAKESGRAIKNTGKLMRPAHAFGAVKESEILLGSINSLDDTAMAVEVRAGAVAKVLKAQLIQSVKDNLEASSSLPEIQFTANELASSFESLSGNQHITSHVQNNVDQAKGYGAFVVTQTPERLSRVSYQELYRAENRHDWRDWPERWDKIGGRFFKHGPSDYAEGRMIAPVNDQIWDDVSDPEIFPDGTGTPYAPFAFGSGMDIKPVPNSELPKLGLAPRRAQARKLSFNASVSFSASFDEDIQSALLDSMSDNEEVELGK